MIFDLGYGSVLTPQHVKVPGGKTAFLGRDLTVTSSWPYRRRRSVDDSRHKRAAIVSTSVTVPIGDIVNPIVGGVSGSVITALVSYPFGLLYVLKCVFFILLPVLCRVDV